MGQKRGVHAFGYNTDESEYFGWNLEHYENIVGDWPWQILGAIRAVEIVWEAAEILFFFICQVNNARFRRFPVG